MKVEVKKLAEMTAPEWCKLAEERIKVFVVEQECPYQEIDEQDYQAYHLTLRDDQEKLIGYTRIMERDDDQVTFGRVLILKEFRGHDFGRQLVQATIDETKRLFPGKSIQIQAQAYLQKFYTSFGFQAISAVYLEDNIPHLDMVLS